MSISYQKHWDGRKMPFSASYSSRDYWDGCSTPWIREFVVRTANDKYPLNHQLAHRAFIATLVLAERGETGEQEPPSWEQKSFTFSTTQSRAKKPSNRNPKKM